MNWSMPEAEAQFRTWVVPGWIMVPEYGVVAAAATIIGLRRLMHPAMSQWSTDWMGLDDERRLEYA